MRPVASLEEELIPLSEPTEEKMTCAGQFTNVSLFVNSTDSYRDCWMPFFTLLDRYWPSLEIPIVLNTEIEFFSFQDLDIHCTQTHLGMAPSTLPTWSKCLSLALDQVKTDYLIYLQDDYFLEGPPLTHLLEEIVSISRERQLDCVQLVPASTSRHPAQDSDTRGLFPLPRDHPYRVNLQAGIWKVNALKSALRRHENPWQFEVWGSKRPEVRRMKVYGLQATTAGEDNYCDVIPYHLTGIVRGQWNRKVVEPLFQSEGLHVEYAARGFYEPSTAMTKRPHLPIRVFNRMRSIF